MGTAASPRFADGCPRCQKESTTSSWIYQEEFWSIGQFGHAPGWTFIQLRRHAESLGELTESELQSLGPALARATTAVQAATQAEAVYLLWFGETLPRHFHVAILPRTTDVPNEHRGGALIQHLADYDGHPNEALEIVRRIRDNLPAVKHLGTRSPTAKDG